MCSHLIPGISDYIATQPNNEELHKFRAIEGPHLPLNLAERHRRLRPDFVPYVLEIGVLYSDFVDKLQFGVKRSDFPRVSYRPMEVSKAVDG